jgi:hypothetical protein
MADVGVPVLEVGVLATEPVLVEPVVRSIVSVFVGVLEVAALLKICDCGPKLVGVLSGLCVGRAATGFAPVVYGVYL